MNSWRQNASAAQGNFVDKHFFKAEMPLWQFLLLSLVSCMFYEFYWVFQFAQQSNTRVSPGNQVSPILVPACIACFVLNILCSVIPALVIFSSLFFIAYLVLNILIALKFSKGLKEMFSVNGKTVEVSTPLVIICQSFYIYYLVNKHGESSV